MRVDMRPRVLIKTMGLEVGLFVVALITAGGI